MKSKYEEYTDEQRKEDLKSVLDIATDPGNLSDAYMQGMANGLILAWTIIAEPYGTDPKYVNGTTWTQGVFKKIIPTPD